MDSSDRREGTRLNKYLSESGVCSRREADRLIQDGRVKIDGRVARLGDQVYAASRVELDGRQISGGGKKVYIALNKPVGVICTTDPREPMNVVDFVGHPKRIYPIGRLDRDSEGLLLLTSDGDIVNRILRAAGKHEKEYVVTVDKPITEDFLRRMAAGVPILDTVTLPCQVTAEGRLRFRIVLVQGLNRQIRRMCEALGYRVTSLRRERIMNIRLGHLKTGDWRNLTPAELRELMDALN